MNLQKVSNQQPQVSSGKEIGSVFVWKMSKTNGGGRVKVTRMRTSHLFYTLRMIWNNKLPEFKFPGARMYNFGSRYTDEYLKRAIFEMSRELATRTDLEAKHQKQLDRMMEILGRLRLPQSEGTADAKNTCRLE